MSFHPTSILALRSSPCRAECFKESRRSPGGRPTRDSPSTLHLTRGQVFVLVIGKEGSEGQRSFVREVQQVQRELQKYSFPKVSRILFLCVLVTTTSLLFRTARIYSALDVATALLGGRRAPR